MTNIYTVYKYGSVYHIFDLTPVDNRKSFYGKAKVIVMKDGSKYLKSYDTIVCKLEGNTLYKTWNAYSATTMRHIDSFCRTFGLPGVGKAAWTNMDYYAVK